MNKLNLGNAFELWKLKQLLSEAKPSILGESIREALKKDNIKLIVKTINDQRQQGHQEAIVNTIGEPAIKLIDKLFSIGNETRLF